MFFNNESDTLVEDEKVEKNVFKNMFIKFFQNEPVEKSLDDFYCEKSVKEIKNIIRQVFESRYSEIENAFNELDEFNEKVLNQELMFQLMKK